MPDTVLGPDADRLPFRGLVSLALGIASHRNAANGFTATKQGAADTDGLSNLLEFAFGLNPNVNDSGSVEADVPGAFLTKRGTPVS